MINPIVSDKCIQGANSSANKQFIIVSGYSISAYLVTSSLSQIGQITLIE